MDSKKFDYNLIRYLVIIVETRSMANAAEVLNVAPSAVSYAVKKMRDHYHDPLFTRTLNGVMPTALAMNLYNKFKVIDADITNVLNLKSISQNTKRSVYIRCDPLTEFWLTEKLLRQHIIPDECSAEFRYVTLDSEQRVSKLRNKEIDIDIGLQLPGDSSLVARPLFDLDFTLICRNDHKTVGESITREQFAKERYVGFGSPFYRTLLRTDAAEAIALRETDPVIVSDSHFNLILASIFDDLLVFCPSRYVQILKKIIPIREVQCDFINRGNVKYVAHIHKQNMGDELIGRVIGLLREGV
ncbi:LysR family transcriptional regulator [Buttiauxella selenatireducens]|uniref:LysR family transcriptional regulator n=1 Tax=Buttiauxella selenatireducens TaxID=3073902 RepID=A0ABY9SF91_9ENTR|nr:LysR family transcriptional regulator [Buttiauxella sp. R73]WMY76172.1 LysR family transcriptional regulator [Buttiauxella sp. R73]